MRRRQLRALKEIIPETPDGTPCAGANAKPGRPTRTSSPASSGPNAYTVIEVVPSFPAGWWIRGQMLKWRGAVFLPLSVSSSVYPTACAA